MKKTAIRWFKTYEEARTWVKENGMPHLKYSIDRFFDGYMVGA